MTKQRPGWQRRRGKPRKAEFQYRGPEPKLEPVVSHCPAHLLPEPCPTCAAYIAGGL